MSKPLSYFLLFLTLLLAFVLYFYKLSSIPSGFYVDEALPGFTAYSLSKTGLDEWGKAFPVTFRFFGFYSPPLFTYSAVPFVTIFGPTIFAVRSLSAIFGLLSIVIIYLLTQELFKNRKVSNLAALILATSPWVVLYARTGYEINPGMAILALGWLFLFISLHRPVFIVSGLIIVILSMYTAYSERFLVPIYLVSYFLFFKDILLSKPSRRYFFAGLIVSIILLLPQFYLLTTPAFFTKGNLSLGNSTLLGFLWEFSSQYLNYFSPQSLFFLPDPDPQRSIPRLAVFYLWLFIPYFLGLLQLYSNRAKLPYKYLFLILFLSPIPAALTHDPFSSHRSLPLVIPLSIILALGLKQILERIPKLVSPILLLLIFSFSLRQLYNSYFLLLPVERAKYWDFGVDQLAQQIKLYPKKHFLIDQGRLSPTYPALAFFLRYPPARFQKEADPSIKHNYYYHPEFNGNLSFGNLTFSNIDWQTDVYINQVIVGGPLAISPSQTIEHSLSPLFVIKDPLGEIRFQAFQTNPRLKCQSSIVQSPLCDQLQ